jgi:hypothetical protein
MVMLNDQKETIQIELKKGKKIKLILLNVEPKVIVPAMLKLLRMKFQHKPIKFPNTKRSSLRLSFPSRWKNRDAKSMLNTIRRAIDWIAAGRGLIRRKEARLQMTMASTSNTVPR